MGGQRGVKYERAAKIYLALELPRLTVTQGPAKETVLPLADKRNSALLTQAALGSETVAAAGSFVGGGASKGQRKVGGKQAAEGGRFPCRNSRP
ncbi:hypothetical protein AAFF_G00085250 [Aldrovandia affinis]|uniref:Uncharacterized protein n=1 Tax=Aldrovandia affinis TaxID=143900 RepID=A0AAD7WCK6_9TELE|nr:hypothetical protein AAFF_G00085250 [Aldrovandia affinis]